MDLNKNQIIAVDFDDTLCAGMWPDIGEPNHKLIAHLKEQQAAGARLILWTCRCGDMLTNAVEWCRDFGLEFDTVNENLPELIELYGNNSRKINADIYIDDKAVNPIPYRQAAGLTSLNPYKNPIDEQKLNAKKEKEGIKILTKMMQSAGPSVKDAEEE